MLQQANMRRDAVTHKSCHIRICLCTWTHIFSLRTVDYQMHLWRAGRMKKTNKDTKGSSATCNKSPVTKQNKKKKGGEGKALALLLTLQWACGKSWPNFDNIPSCLLFNEFVRHFKSISKRSFCQYIQNITTWSHLPLCNKLGQQNKAIKLQTWTKKAICWGRGGGGGGLVCGAQEKWAWICWLVRKQGPQL